MPEADTSGLGIHAALDLTGKVRFYPDTRYVDSLDYQVDDRLRERFAQAVRRHFPALDCARLAPGYADVRPKLSGPARVPKILCCKAPLITAYRDW